MLTCLSDSGVYKAATMDLSSLLLPSFFAIMNTASSALYSSNLVEFIAKFPNCLIATYDFKSHTHRRESSDRGENVAIAMTKASVPFASYNNLSHRSSTPKTQFNVNCYLLLESRPCHVEWRATLQEPLDNRLPIGIHVPRKYQWAYGIHDLIGRCGAACRQQRWRKKYLKRYKLVHYMQTSCF